MQRLRSEFGIYGVDSGRICVAALNERNIDSVVQRDRQGRLRPRRQRAPARQGTRPRHDFTTASRFADIGVGTSGHVDC